MKSEIQIITGTLLEVRDVYMYIVNIFQFSFDMNKLLVATRF